jgi:hypothetical protein
VARSHADSVKDQTTSNGPSSFVAVGIAPNGFRTLTSALTDGATYALRIENAAQNEWVVADFTWTASTSTLTIGTVYASSNSGSSVTFSAGTKAITVVTVGADLDIGTVIHAATLKSTPVPADEIALSDSAASNAGKRATLQSVLSRARSARTSNTILAAADLGAVIDITSGTFTQTFTAAATLGSGWWCYLRNSGTGVITVDPNSTETIDGLTSYAMYPNECRLVMCDGTGFYTLVLSPFFMVFGASATFVKPPGYTGFGGYLWGGGGSGAKGLTASLGGGGGGGGACFPFVLQASQIGATQSVTIAAAATGPSASSTSGVDGGSSAFCSYTAYGGAGGESAASPKGGGGGGAFGAGYSFSNGGEPFIGLSSQHQVYGGGYGATSTLNAEGSIWGGAGGGSNGTRASSGSQYGGAGGGGVDSAGSAGTGGGGLTGGSGGNASSASSGGDGTAPGGGGGGTVTGTKAGDGARGQMNIWGIA